MNRLIPFLLVVVSGLSFAAAAQTTGPAQAPVPADPVTGPAADRSADPFAAEPAVAPSDETAVQDKRAARDKALREHPYCLHETGSLIRPRGAPQRCAGIGQAYTREDLQRTGQTDIGDALRVLSSSIR